MNEIKNIYTSFRRQVGVICNCNQYIELSLRSFYKDHSHDILDSDEHLDDYSKKLNLSITEYPKSIINNVSCLYIVNIQSCFSDFIKSFCDLPGSPVNGHIFKEGEDFLNAIINAVYKDKKSKEIDALYNVCKYYRLIRNAFIHKNPKENQELKEARRQIEKQENHFFDSKRFNKLSAPNSLENIQFDDFVLFARSSVDLAKRLFDDSEYNISEILGDDKFSLSKILKKYINNEKRLVDRTKQYFGNIYPIGVFKNITYSDIIPHLEH